MTELILSIQLLSKGFLILSGILCLFTLISLLRSLTCLLEAVIQTFSPLENTANQLEKLSDTLDDYTEKVRTATIRTRKSLDRLHFLGHLLEFFHLKKRKRHA